MSSTNQPPRASIPLRAGETTGKRPLPKGVVGISPVGSAPPGARPESAPRGTLIVGQGIQVKGEVESCRTLVVEGRVEASLKAEALEVLKGGLFKGTAEVERAEIAGAVEGALAVRGQLAITATGRASGRIRYARIAIEAGGEISGDVAVASAAEAEAETSSLTATAS
ncbi:MAG: polymer-forming cytoskeletal protein [Kiloniellaceae bacterium]